jgi:hypothetical protein
MQWISGWPLQKRSTNPEKHLNFGWISGPLTWILGAFVVVCLPSFLPSTSTTSSTSTLTSTSSPAGCCVAMELLTPEGLRVDGRRARELRAITCKYVSCRCIIDRKPSTNRQQFCLSCCVCISWLHRCVHRVRHMKNGHLQQTRWVGLLSTGQHKGCCFSLWTSITSTCFFDGFVT